MFITSLWEALRFTLLQHEWRKIIIFRVKRRNFFFISFSQKLKYTRKSEKWFTIYRFIRINYSILEFACNLNKTRHIGCCWPFLEFSPSLSLSRSVKSFKNTNRHDVCNSKGIYAILDDVTHWKYPFNNVDTSTWHWYICSNVSLLFASITHDSGCCWEMPTVVFERKSTKWKFRAWHWRSRWPRKITKFFNILRKFDFFYNKYILMSFWCQFFLYFHCKFWINFSTLKSLPKLPLKCDILAMINNLYYNAFVRARIFWLLHKLNIKAILKLYWTLLLNHIVGLNDVYKSTEWKNNGEKHRDRPI